MTVLIKGAGVAGLVTAVELARRGIAVAVAETGRETGRGASHYAGGMLAPWCERESADETVLQLGLSAADWWESALPGSVSRRGTLVVAPPRDTAELKRFAARTRGYRVVDAAEIGTIEPALSGRFSTGLFFEHEAHLDPRAALAGLTDKLQSLGATVHLAGAGPDPASFDTLIDCTGPAGIGRIAGLRGVRGEMLYLETRDITLSRPVRLIHPRHPIYMVPRETGRIMLGATMIEAADDGPITARSMMELLNAAYVLHPAFGEARIVETGSGIRPAFADNVPRLVETADGFALTGLHRHGFLLSPALAVQAADRLAHLPRKTERLTA